MPNRLKALSMLLLGFSGCMLARVSPDPAEPPVIPVGLDAFTMWDKWAYLRIGQRTFMTSTYDRRGGNESADASHFLYQLADDRNVSLDVAGPGVLAFVRTNHWHGSPWHYVVDGRDHVVQESSSANPLKPVENSVFLPAEPFPNPLTWTWSQTKGADLMWVPVPFEKSFTLAYERTRYGTGYYIYHQFAPGTRNLSRPIRSWTPADVPPAAVLDLLRRSGTDIAPAVDPENRHVGKLDLAAGATAQLADIAKAPATIRSLKLDIGEEQAATFGDAWLRIYWDGAAEPSVAAPVELLFGAGSLFNREKREYLVKAFPVSIRFGEGRVHFAMYFPMPFMRHARIELVEKTGVPLTDVRYEIRCEPYDDPPNWVGQFHATYVDHGKPELGQDLVFLDTEQVEGGGDWCGHFVGTSFIFSDRAVLTTLEADPRFYFDDMQTPHAQGTGTEEWGGGGDYWGGRTMTLPFAGHPVGCPDGRRGQPLNDEDKIQSAYRYLLSDLMPFGKRARITFEHGGHNDSVEHYQSVTYWYGLHQPFLKLTDTLHVGDEADAARHHYESPTASPVQTLTTRYEWGVDTVQDPQTKQRREVYPATTDTGRNMTGTSTFTLRIEPRNLGVILRRKMDYAFPNQRATVSIAEDKPDTAWHEVGTWYTAGSNTCVYSDPKGELGATLHNVQTSNRRWRESEFLLPRHLTEGRHSIRVRIEFQPRGIPLFPGHPLAEEKWSEYRYWAYCFIMPKG